MKDKRTYESWCKMKQRCLSPRCDQYKWYGGRGITVCERWMDYANFLEDMGVRPAGMTLDRIADATVYSKETCKWSTAREQANNRRSCVVIDGMPLQVWAAVQGITYNAARQRLFRARRRTK